jgi:hypothetical protein
MEILVAYLLEMTFTLLILSLGFLLLRTKFSSKISQEHSSANLNADRNSFGLVFMGPIAEKELFARLNESQHLIEKGAELFFFIDQPFVFKNQIKGVHIILPGENYQKAQNLLSLCARHANNHPEFLVLLNPKLTFTEQLWLAVEEHINAGYDFFELQAVNPFLMDCFESEKKNDFKSFFDIFYSKFIKNDDSLSHHTIVISSELYEQIPGNVLSNFNSKFLSNGALVFDSVSNVSNDSLHIDLERYFKPNFKLAYGRFLVQLNWSIFLSSLSKTILSKFSNIIFRTMSVGMLVFAAALTYTDKLFFENPTIFYYLGWTGIFSVSLILLANVFRNGSRTVVASFPFKRSVKQSVAYSYEAESGNQLTIF